MKRYLIANHVSESILGWYSGESPEAALDALAREAGYPSLEAAQKVGALTDLVCVPDEPLKGGDAPKKAKKEK